VNDDDDDEYMRTNIHALSGIRIQSQHPSNQGLRLKPRDTGTGEKYVVIDRNCTFELKHSNKFSMPQDFTWLPQCMSRVHVNLFSELQSVSFCFEHRIHT
jgi:hypothetical protein